MYDFRWINTHVRILFVMHLAGINVDTQCENQLVICPFHDDHNLSLSIYRNRCVCFGACNMRRALTVIDFVMRWFKLTSPRSACQKLEQLGVKVRLLPYSALHRSCKNPNRPVLSDHDWFIIRRTALQQHQASPEYKKGPSSAKLMAKTTYDQQIMRGCGFAASFGELAELSGF